MKMSIVTSLITNNLSSVVKTPGIGVSLTPSYDIRKTKKVSGWDLCLPSALSQKLTGGEDKTRINIRWKDNTPTAAIDTAKDVIQQLNANLPIETETILVDALGSYLKEFSDFCQENLVGCKEFTVKIVASCGSSGTHCPKWHMDYVPVRWIQSLVGPGCDFLTSYEGVHWNQVNNRLVDDIDKDIATVYSVSEQEAVLLVGHRWSEFHRTRKKKEEMQSFNPVIHRSPSNIPLLQHRLLLTQDVAVSDCC